MDAASDNLNQLVTDTFSGFANGAEGIFRIDVSIDLKAARLVTTRHYTDRPQPVTVRHKLPTQSRSPWAGVDGLRAIEDAIQLQSQANSAELAVLKRNNDITAELVAAGNALFEAVKSNPDGEGSQ
jgi:hypothetical protein